MTSKKKEKIVFTKGKKKAAVARVRIREGHGTIKINGYSIDAYEPAHVREIIMEPITIAKKVLGDNFINTLDIRANVKGGGVSGQAFAVRTAIGKALVEWSESEDLKNKFLEYDRSLIIDDVRRKEPKKFLRKGARAKPIKSFR